MNERKFTGNTIKKNRSLTSRFFDGVYIHNGFGVPSEYVYFKREVVGVVLVETPGGIKDKYIFRVVSSGKPLPGGSKVRGNFQSSCVQSSSPESKSIAAPIDKRVGNLRIQRKLTSCSKANGRINGP